VQNIGIINIVARKPFSPWFVPHDQNVSITGFEWLFNDLAVQVKNNRHEANIHSVSLFIYYNPFTVVIKWWRIYTDGSSTCDKGFFFFLFGL
jgi:hypothetical protein